MWGECRKHHLRICLLYLNLLIKYCQSLISNFIFFIFFIGLSQIEHVVIKVQLKLKKKK